MTEGVSHDMAEAGFLFNYNVYNYVVLNNISDIIQV